MEYKLRLNTTPRKPRGKEYPFPVNINRGQTKRKLLLNVKCSFIEGDSRSSFFPIPGRSHFDLDHTTTVREMSDLVGFGHYFDLNGKVALITGGIGYPQYLSGICTQC